MSTPHAGLIGARSRVLSALAISTALLTTGATLPSVTSIEPVSATSLELADISIQVPIVIPSGPVIIVPRDRVEEEREVTVRFVAQGEDWATIYLNGRRLFQAFNTRRDYAVNLEPGAYYLEVTGVTQFDVWDSGYLDVGRDDANLIVIRYGKSSGINVLGDPYAWFPD
ncbi:hypothetical protein PN498_06300 [Oscillatoria sp. CS-180]|uniref:hypothetical protein n=1 Tax=Oscillatoria sp. CS-180 TaxID=3021720 RepID=UPI00232CFEA7|nr:hypothetical protein [Oscillatoria sp. CS-180]MDB9525592.1 hypothetical protein [Oscillatoria sp. CS-180]